MTTTEPRLSPEVAAALASDMTIDITTIGRQSGQQRRIEIWFLNVDNTIYITGTPGPRDWFANMAANPAFEFHLKESVQADLSARASVVTDPAERHRVFEAATARWYRNQDSLDELIADAPMVRVEFR